VLLRCAFIQNKEVSLIHLTFISVWFPSLKHGVAIH